MQFNPFDCKIKTFHLESQAWKKYSSEQPEGPHCVIFIFCILSEKTPRSLFEVCAEIEGRREGTPICCQIHQGERIFFNIGALNMLLTYSVHSNSEVCVIPGDQKEKTLSSTALHRSSSGGEWEDFLQADPLHRETKLRGEGGDQSPGESSCQSGRGAAGEDTEGDSRTQEGRRWAWEAFSHWRPHPLPPGMEQKLTRPVMWE